MHKLLFDQNLSYRIIKHIEHLFPDSSHVRLVGLDKKDDLTVWKHAKKHNLTIVTQDTDFNALSTLYGYPPKIIWMHIGNKATKMIIELLQKKHDVICTFLDDENIGLLELN